MDENAGRKSDLLKQREDCNISIKHDPHNPAHHICRGWIHSKLGFPDLAAADAYRALTLLESVADPDSSEYRAWKRVGSTESSGDGDSGPSDSVEEDFAALRIAEGSEGGEEEDGDFELVSQEEYEASIGDVYRLLVRSLFDCGCTKDAYEFCVRALHLSDVIKSSDRDVLQCLLSEIQQFGRRKDGEGFDASRLEIQGFARRVVYPWNMHEPDRSSSEVVQFLNERLQHVAPKCEVRSVALPSLHEAVDKATESGIEKDEVSIQLGLFAKEDISPGEILLHESSVLTATNRIHDDICDACNGRLPELSAAEPPVGCGECADTIFCSQKCHDAAQTLYHGAICGLEGLETIGKDIQNPKDKADYLYLLLLGRAMAMAATQDVHPLDLPEVKYIWGDFHELEPLGTAEPADSPADNPIRPASATLPFSFQLNILQPMRILEEMDIDPFASLHLYDTWVLTTLYAKFRGTASGRLSTWDGGPEVCAVHPLWCLANHSCDPNVRWEWGGEITFAARSAEERVEWGPEDERKRRREREGGIRRDEEILNHYCDLGLPVKERREWAMGALGGACQCPRCIWEAASKVLLN
jgi:hypothetical protein